MRGYKDVARAVVGTQAINAAYIEKEVADQKAAKLPPPSLHVSPEDSECWNCAIA